MANGDKSKVQLPDKPLDLKPHEWELRTKFLAMLVERCSISDWSPRAAKPGDCCVPVAFEIEGIDISYDLANPYYEIADGRFRMEVPEDQLAFYSAVAFARPMLQLGMPKRINED